MHVLLDPGTIASMAAPPPRKLATVSDLRAIPEHERHHSPLHARGQARLCTRIGDPYDRPRGRRGPGGWWILAAVEAQLAADQIHRPDLAGWRRERLPTLPDTSPVLLRPDWVCEILSPSNSTNDTIKKLRTYHRAGIPHYWILDPMNRSLTVYRWAEPGYLVVLAVESGERVHAEPFEAVELDLEDLFGDATETDAPAEGI